MADEAYIVRFGGGLVNHACLPKRKALGHFEFDQTMGGGLRILCGFPAVGKAIVSEETKSVARWVTCTRCRLAAGLKPKADVGRVPWTEVCNPNPRR